MKSVAMLALVAMIGVFAVGCEKKPAANTPAKPANPATNTTPPTNSTPAPANNTTPSPAPAN